MLDQDQPATSPSNSDNPIPEEPKEVPEFTIHQHSNVESSQSPPSLSQSAESITWSDRSSLSEPASTPQTEPQLEDTIDEVLEEVEDLPAASIRFTGPNDSRRRASTTLISQDAEGIRQLLGDGATGTKLIEKYCCGGGCCLMKTLPPPAEAGGFIPVVLPDNAAFRSLELKLGPLSMDTPLTSTTPLPENAISFDPVEKSEPAYKSNVHVHPPSYLQPHAPYDVFSAPVYGARELTKPGAEKRTFHFDLDVTDYPDEGGVDFKVGGAIGICPPNDTRLVDEVFDAIGTPKFVRDRPVTLVTSGGRWPTMWGEDEARRLTTTRRELLTWCIDLQSTPPTKPLLRLLAEHADAKNEQKILLYLCSAEGQGAFCDLRTGPHITVGQLLNAFPTSQPPLPALMAVLKPITPRFYSLSNDPHVSSSREGLAGRRLIEMAVTIHETPDWRAGTRTGVGSGFLERIANRFISSRGDGITSSTLASSPSDTAEPATAQLLDIRIPMFRGLMANPLSREFVSDGPMMLIGAGVGMAPFRGFILNRLKNANCANKIWLVQGVRDSNLDELYSGELGTHEKDIKTIVQSRKARKHNDEARYVQDEVRMQADVVWHVVNAVDGRIFVCGSSKGMGEGVHESLIDVACKKAGMNRAEAETFWEKKREDGHYIAETW